MNISFETLIGTSENGVRYRVMCPRIEGEAVFSDFYERYAQSFARCGGGLSSVVASARGEVLGERLASVVFEITSFREGRACGYTVRSQTWDLENRVILSLRDLKMQDCPKNLRFWVKNGEKNNRGWHLIGGQIHLYICNPNRIDPSRLRRSEYHTVMQDNIVELAKSRTLCDLLRPSPTDPECDKNDGKKH